MGDGAISSSLMSDVSSTHKGYRLDVNYQHHIALGGGIFQASIGLTAQSANYNDYYYGVRASEVTNTRTAYQAKAGFNPYLSYQ